MSQDDSFPTEIPAEVYDELLSAMEDRGYYLDYNARNDYEDGELVLLNERHDRAWKWLTRAGGNQP